MTALLLGGSQVYRCHSPLVALSAHDHIQGGVEEEEEEDYEEDVEENVAAKGNGLKPTEGLASVGAKRGREESAEAPNGGAEQDAKKVKV